MATRFHRAFISALVVLIAFVLSAPLGAATGPAPRPWYAARLEAAGFQVFPSPQRTRDFTVSGLDGSTARLSGQKGKIVLLNFWATWCPPCKAEMPSLQKLWKANKDKAFMILAVSVGETKATVSGFVGQNHYDYPFFLDPTGAIGNLYNVTGIPTTYIFDKDGLAIARAVGGLEYDSPAVIALFADLSIRPQAPGK